MASKFNIVITVFTKYYLLNINTKYYKSPFENFRVRKNAITVTKLSKNNYHKLNNKYYNLDSVFEKFIF